MNPKETPKPKRSTDDLVERINLSIKDSRKRIILDFRPTISDEQIFAAFGVTNEYPSILKELIGEVCKK